MNFQLVDHSLTKKIENFPGLISHAPKLPGVQPVAPEEEVEVDKPKQKGRPKKQAAAVEAPQPAQKAVGKKRAVI